MANPSNVTLRVSVGRPLLYEEGDANFQELINVINDQDGHIASTTAHASVDITYTNTTSGLAANEVQGALDELSSGIDAHINDTTAHDAYNIVYVNTTSGLTSTNVNNAVDEVQSNLETHINDTTAHDASDIVYSGVASSLTSVNTNDAIDEVQSNLETHMGAVDPHSQYTTDSEANQIAEDNSILYSIALG